MLTKDWQPAMPLEDLWIGEMIGLELAGVPVLLVNIEAELWEAWERSRTRR